jgi:hypothetical protein
LTDDWQTECIVRLERERDVLREAVADLQRELADEREQSLADACDECNASEDALRRMLALAAGTLTDAVDAVDALADYRSGLAPMDDVLRSIGARARDIATFLD